MLPDRVSNPGPLTYESGVLPIALRGPAKGTVIDKSFKRHICCFNFNSILCRLNDLLYRLSDMISSLNEIFVVLIVILIFLFHFLF